MFSHLLNSFCNGHLSSIDSPPPSPLTSCHLPHAHDILAISFINLHSQMTANVTDKSTPSATPMAIFRTIGNRFRRPDVMDASPYDSPSTPDPQPAPSLPAHHEPAEPAESPDLYYEDRPLGISIQSLEQVRGALRQLSGAANDHSKVLQSSSSSLQSLGHTLQTVLDAKHPGEQQQQQDIENLSGTVNSHGPGAKDENDMEKDIHFANFLSKAAVDTQQSLGNGMIHLSQVSSKLSLAIAKPINDLMVSFEDRYVRKIIPLRKRYVDQKGQYLKYMRSADMADTDEKRSYYEALADASKPVWNRTSTELRTEADVMTELTAKNIAQWSRTIALQHERAFAISNANMADAFTRAKELTTLGKS